MAEMDIKVLKDWKQFGSKIILVLDCIEVDLTQQQAQDIVDQFAKIGICAELPILKIED